MTYTLHSILLSAGLWAGIIGGAIVLVVLVLYLVFIFAPLLKNVRLTPMHLSDMLLHKLPIKKVVNYKIQANESGLEDKLKVKNIINFYLAKIDPQVMINALITAKNGKLDIPLEKFKEHYLAKGDVQKVTEAMVAAKNADVRLPEEQKLKLDFDSAAAIDLAGIDVLKAVEWYVTPHPTDVLEITAVTKDGIELTAEAKLTVQTNMTNLISGVGIETVCDRVNEGIVTAMGAETYQHILENPYKIADKVEKDPDLYKDAAYKVLSVDVHGINIGVDRGAILRAEKAKAQVEEEKAKEQHMKTLAAEARVHHIQTESEVQKAMAAAFLDGKLSIHEYHEMQNTEADTEMREKLAEYLKDDEEGHH